MKVAVDMCGLADGSADVVEVEDFGEVSCVVVSQELCVFVQVVNGARK